MPIFKGTTKMKAAYKGISSLSAIYKGSYLVWLKKFLDTISGTTPLSLPKATADPIDEANLYGMTEQRRLPSGYTELEYIESNRTRYIDTGIKGNQNTKIEMKLSMTQNENIVHICGDVINQSKAISFNISQNSGQVSRWGNQSKNGNAPIAIDTPYNISISQEGYYVNDTLFWNPDDNDFTTVGNLYIFNAYGGISAGLIGKIYWCKIYDNNVLVRDFVPCYRNSDNKIGMYDIVNNEFYKNQGAGDFTAGPTTTPTPDNPMPIYCNNGELKVSPNLFNGQFDTGWGIDSYRGSITSVSGGMSFYIPVKAGQTYTISRSAVGSSSYFYYGTYALRPYSTGQQCVSYGDIGINALTGTITVPTGANYLAFFFGAGTSPNVQVEYGSTATSYMPYGQVYVDGDVETIEIDTTGDTATAENLLAIDTYKDVQDLISGSVTRNVGILVLDGTENYVEFSTGVFYCSDALPNAKYSTNVSILCNLFVGKESGGGSSSTANYQCWLQATSAYPRLYIRYDAMNDAASFKNWVAQQYTNGTPVIIVYPLAESATSSVTSQELECQEGTNIVSSNKGAREMEITYWRN